MTCLPADCCFRVFALYKSICPTAPSVSGDAMENNFHYFYVCPLFIRHRIQLLNSLRKFQDVLNLDILLKGSPILTVEENTEIFDAVHHFITGSRMIQ